ncbi:hypothetical protein JTB14_017532 [Gonioctena quinquepunctata]|nr:hypothetical protein JTB14_017532 [Gonioctena quinquepunctata]
MSLPKGVPERKKIIGDIRKRENFVFNTDKNYNDGELIVSRRPKNAENKSAKDFGACANCKAFFSKLTLRVHFKSCTGINNQYHRMATVLSKKIAARIHPKASKIVENYLFPPLRDDDVARAIRYDELIIIYANKMVQKYRESRHFQMIRQRLRLLGKFLLTIKKSNNGISDLTSIYDPKYVDDVLIAINVSAKYTESENSYEAPSVAFSLGTLLKQIGNMLITESIKDHNDLTKKNTEDFLKVFAQEVNINVNRIVAETQLKMQRRKNIILPSMEDIRKLCDYLTTERNLALNDVKKMISLATWLKLAELTLTSIQLFNRRRAGEVERMKIEDFEAYQTIEESNADLFKSLSNISKQIARKYIRFTIRGKLNRTVPVLLDTNLLECVKLVIKYRTEIGVSKYNPYIFGLPGGDKKQYPHLQACNLMRKHSECCGAKHPERLRGTHLRKHIATTCVTLNLEAQDISDLSNFMGHSENFHKGIYRQPIVSREILGISKLLEAAQGIEAADDSDDNNSSSDEESGGGYKYKKPAKRKLARSDLRLNTSWKTA